MAVGGILPPPLNYFSRIKEVLDRHGILVVIDDVICAFGRLGHWFGWETTGVQPDMVSLAKELTSGYVPMSATLVGERVWSVLEEHQDQIGVFGHGFTMSGHPVAAAAALANIAVIEKGDLLSKARDTGEFLLRTITNATRHIPEVVNVRGRGLLVGIQLDGVDVSEVAQKCLDLGLVVRAIVGRNTIALAPPLITSEEEVLTIVDTIVKVLAESSR
jgi:adenosylmethionine-8-amino-7-oxononanoate aminotransferase